MDEYQLHMLKLENDKGSLAKQVTLRDIRSGILNLQGRSRDLVEILEALIR